MSEQNPTWLTTDEVAERFGVTRNTVQKWRERGEPLPYTRIGGRIRYKLEDVIAYENKTIFPTKGDQNT